MLKQTLSCLTLLPLVAFLPPARAAAPIEPVMVRIPAGEFSMGGGASDTHPAVLDAAALPIHRVRLPAFQIGKYEVTVKEFRQFVEATGYKVPEQCRHEPGPRWFSGPSAGRFDRNALTDSEFQPAVCVGWAAATAYADWLAAQTGKPYRLLTEAEWEYAARAGSDSVYPLGRDASQACARANLADRSAEFAALSRFGASYLGFMGGHTQCDDGAGFASVVGMYAPNAWGLHDLIGNASEYVQDCWNEDHTGAPADGSARQSGDCNRRVLRGGSWHWRAVSASARGGMPMDFIGVIEGFRLALSLDPGRTTSNALSPSALAFERELQAAQAKERTQRQQRLAFPAAPLGLQLHASSGTELHLSWQPSAEAGITGYHVYRSETLGGNLQRIASDVQGSSFVASSAPSRKHSYAVVAANRDVFSAFSERVHSPDTTQKLPGLIQAEDFNGSQAVTVGRINPNEDAEAPTAGLNLTGPAGLPLGAWTEYQIEVPTTGRYRLSLRYAALRDSQGLRLSVNGQALKDQALPSTGGGRQWQTLESGPISLTAGTHRLRIESLDEGWKLNWLRLD